MGNKNSSCVFMCTINAMKCNIHNITVLYKVIFFVLMKVVVSKDLGTNIKTTIIHSMSSLMLCI